MKKKTSILLSIGILLFLIIVLGYFLIIKNQQSMRSKYEMERSARIIMSIDLINVSSKLFYYDNKTYFGFKDPPDVQQAKESIIQNEGSDFIINISTDGESYCSSVFIPGRNSFYCIDNNSEISGKFSTSTPLCSTNYFSCEEALKDETADWKEVVLTGMIGDEIPLDSIEKECNRRLESYLQSVEFENKSFSECRLIGSKQSIAPEECSRGMSVVGCYVCTLRCR